MGRDVAPAPILIGALALTRPRGHGTPLAVIVVAAPAGGLEHRRHGNILLSPVPWLALEAAAGGPLASALALRLPQPVLTRGFALSLLASAVQLWLKPGEGQKAQPDQVVDQGPDHSGS